MPNQDIQDINYTDPNSIVPEATHLEPKTLTKPHQSKYEKPK